MTSDMEKINEQWDRASLSGFYEVHGCFFECDSQTESFIAEADIRQRILAVWDDASKLYKLDIGYVLVQANTSFQDVTKTAGAALIKQGRFLSNRLRITSSSTAKNEHTPIHQLQLLHHGKWHQVALNNQNEFDPAQWFEAGDYQCFVLEASAIAITEKPVHVNFGQRSNTSDVVKKEGLKPSSELTQVLDDLKRKAKAGKGADAANSTAYGAPEAGISFLTHIRAGLSRLLMRSPLGDVIGKSQAKFIEDTLKQFQDGNLDDALKRAIPLGSMKDALEGTNHPSTGRFMPRSELSISMQRNAGGRSVSLDEQVLEMLKLTYQRAFEKLDAEGRIEEAAFVLVDLLQDIDQAISYLEKHQKFLMAAQIAEGHQVEAARIIRQWILAGDWKRAVQIAHISNRYEEAITLLSSTHKQQADDLRWMLAKMHHDSGNLETAIEIGWPVNDKRAEVLAWLRQAVALGGSLAIRNQLKLALHDVDNEDEHITAIHHLFQDDTISSAAHRLQLIDELNLHHNNPLARSFASMALRPYLRDVAKGWVHHDESRWNRLIALSNDKVLGADVWRVKIDKSNSKQLLSDQTHTIQYQLSPCFGRQIHDCQRLADGSLLVAYGHAGFEHRSKLGELLASYPDICHQIIMSDQGYQALLVAVHEGFQEINIFDLAKRSTTYWLQTKLDTWAENYDGLSWIVAQADRVLVLDLRQTSVVSLWSLGDLKGDVTMIRRDPEFFSFLVQNEAQNEIWKYRLPDLFLKERTPWSHETVTAIPAGISSTGKLVLVSEDLRSFAFHSTGDDKYHTLNEGTAKTVWTYANWLIVASDAQESQYLSVYSHCDGNDLRLVFDIPYPKVEKLACHCNGDFLILYSDVGRVMVIELEYGGVVTDLSL